MPNVTLKTLASSPRGDVIDNATAFSGKEVFVMSELLQADLESLNVSGPICVSALNAVGLVTLFLALFRMQIPFALLSPKAPDSTVKRVMHSLRPTLLITDDFPPLGASAFGESAAPHVLLSSLNTGVRLFALRLKTNCISSFTRDDRRISLYKITSGSAGEPKIVMFSDSQVVTEAENVSVSLAVTNRDGIFLPVSILHSYGFDLGFLTWLWTGATLFLRRGFVASGIEHFAQSGATIFLGIPRMYQMFLARKAKQIRDLSYVRLMLSCTSSLAAQTILRFQERFGVTLCQHYGTSETGGLTSQSPSQVSDKLTSVGKPLTGVEISLLDEGGQEIHEGFGYVFARGAAIALGYLDEPAHHSKDCQFTRGGFCTRDLGRLDRDGFLYLEGDPGAEARDGKFRKHQLIMQ